MPYVNEFSSSQSHLIEADRMPRLFFHERCARLLECLPSLQHDPNRPEDVLKVDADEDGVGGETWRSATCSGWASQARH